MLIDLNADVTPICFRAPTVTAEVLNGFNSAIGAQYVKGAAPTFGTVYRKGDFEFLKRLRVDLKNLLHTEQDYEYLSDFCEGDSPDVETQLTSVRERRGMVFVVLTSEIKVKGQLRVRSKSSFVLRESNKG